MGDSCGGNPYCGNWQFGLVVGLAFALPCLPIAALLAAAELFFRRARPFGVAALTMLLVSLLALKAFDVEAGLVGFWISLAAAALCMLVGLYRGLTSRGDETDGGVGA